MLQEKPSTRGRGRGRRRRTRSKRWTTEKGAGDGEGEMVAKRLFYSRKLPAKIKPAFFTNFFCDILDYRWYSSLAT